LVRKRDRGFIDMSEVGGFAPNAALEWGGEELKVQKVLQV
jgi:hypothetical protein